MPTIREIQQRLNELGARPKLLIDGDPGRLTQAAVTDFQLRTMPTEIKHPGTIGPKTIKALGFPSNDLTVKLEQRASGVPVLSSAPVYLVEARRKLGLHEKRNHDTLWAYLKANGGSVGDPAKNPWCGDFVESVIAKTLPQEPLPSNPYYALNWSRWGQPLDSGKPALGAIVTFKRFNGAGKLIGGHIGLLVGHDKDFWHVLGGNQSDAVTISKIAKGRLDAMRWPSTLPLPRQVLATSSFNGTISTNEA